MNVANHVDAGTTDASLAARLEQAAAFLQRGLTAASREDARGDRANADAKLDELLPVLGMLRHLRSSIASESGSDPTPEELCFDATGTLLGEFRVIREIGRGGMGVVYEAEQIPLNRRVALKVLPFASLLDPRRRRRFQNEARAAASLDHPHIVPVYAVGCERDVHYYAMRLVDGKSLAEFIKQKCVRRLGGVAFNCQDLFCGKPARDVDGEVGTDEECDCSDVAWPRRWSSSVQYVRTVVEIAAQAADALDYAHESGVIHRDVKPSNLLITRDGHLWVTDFGLAQIPGERALTLSGDVVGTMRYMSPEQASPKPTVDHRTDIYSLGVTLYELLTLQPAFSADDPRHLLNGTISRRVSAPSKENRAVPKDLENIVLKAMAETPEERYQTALGLADDLRRFLDGRPVAAKPPTFLDRTKKLVRRNAGTVWSLLFGLSLAVVVLLAGVFLIARERSAAEDAAQQARQGAELALRRQRETEQEKRRAEAVIRNARAAVDRMFMHADQQLADFPQSDRIRHDLLEDSLAFYQKILQQKPTDDSVRYDLAVAFNRVCNINHRLGNTVEARSACLAGEQLLQELVQKDASDPRYQLALAGSFADIADIDLGLSGNRRQVEGYLRRQVDLLAGLAAKAPDNMHYRQRLARALTEHASLLADMGRLRQAEESFRNALDIWQGITGAAEATPSWTLGRARTERGWGELLTRRQAFTHARDHLQQAASLLATASDDKQTQLRLERVRAAQVLALIDCQLGNVAAAERGLRAAIAVSRQLVDDFPETIDFQYLLAVCERDLFRALSVAGRDAEAQEVCLASTQRLAQIVASTDGELQHCLELASNYCCLALWNQANGRLEAADQYSQRSARLRESCVARFPQASEAHASLAWYLSMCPVVARREVGRAVVLAQQAVALEPENGAHWRVLGAAQLRAGCWSESIDALEKAVELNGCATGCDSFLLASAYARAGRPAEARLSFDEAQRWASTHRWDGLNLAPLQAETSELIDALGKASL